MKYFNDTSVAFASKSNKDLKQSYWLFKMLENPKLVSFGGKMANLAFSLKLPVSFLFKQTIFKQFCGGENLQDCQKTIDKLSKYKIGTILDYSIEGKESEADFKNCFEETLRTIDIAKADDNIPFCVIKLTGIAEFDLLHKINDKVELSNQEREDYLKVMERFRAICKKAFENDIPLFVDAEKSWIQDAVDQMTMSMMAQFNKEKAIIFNTIQLYRHDRLDYLKQSFQQSQQQKFNLGVKLVRGAYMEIERERAEEKGYPSPIQKDKASTDSDFNAAIDFCFEQHESISFCVATHNEESTVKAMDLLESKGLSKNEAACYFAQLYGMSDQISFTLSDKGYNVAKYVPYGPVKDVMPYLIRRAEENTSVAGQTPRELALIKSEIERRKR